MKHRATLKADIGDLLKRTDIKGTAVDVVIRPSGQVVGVKTLLGQPLFSPEIEEAVRDWTFRPEKVNDQSVASRVACSFIFAISAATSKAS